jgi:hypothetical protein
MMETLKSFMAIQEVERGRRDNPLPDGITPNYRAYNRGEIMENHESHIIGYNVALPKVEFVNLRPKFFSINKNLSFNLEIKWIN